MDLKEQNILIFTRTMDLGGTENVVLQLCEIFQHLVNKIIVCSCGGVNTRILAAMGVKHYEIPDIERKTPNTVVAVSNTIKAIVKNEEITLIHTHHRMAAFYVAMLRMYKKCYFVNTSHNTFTNKIGFTRFAYKKANIIACGEMVKNNLVNIFGLPEENITVIHNAVKPFEGECAIDSLIEKLHGERCFVIGNVGRLSEQKGFEYYIEAVPYVLRKHAEARFLIIGAGEEEKRLKQMVKQAKLEKKVFFMGYRGDIQNLILQIDLMVLSSLWEGLPLTPIETFSVKKTIIATAVDGTVEVIEDGQNGILVEPKNVTQLAEKIIWVIENPDLKEQMEKQAKITYERKFSFENFAESYIECYTSVINGK